MTVWFHACWMLATQKDGVSALSMQKPHGDQLPRDRLGDAAPPALGLRAPGSRPSQREGEVDETYIGGEEPGLRGGRPKGNKALVSVAVEQRQKGFGRARMVPSLTRGRDGASPPGRPRRAGLHSGHGWLRLPRPRPHRLQPRPDRRRQARTARRAPCRRRRPTDGCSAPTRGRWTTPTCPATSTSSVSASTATRHATAACSSYACWNSPSPTTQSAGKPSSSAPRSRASGHQSRRVGPAATGRTRTCGSSCRPWTGSTHATRNGLPEWRNRRSSVLM